MKFLKKINRKNIFVVVIKIIIFLCLCLCFCVVLYTCNVIRFRKINMQHRFCSSLFQMEITTFTEYTSCRLIQAEVQENLGMYLIVKVLNSDYPSRDYNVDVSVRNREELTNIKSSDMVYICCNGVIYDSMPPSISADRIFLSEEKSIEYLWEQYMEYGYNYGIIR